MKNTIYEGCSSSMPMIILVVLFITTLIFLAMFLRERKKYRTHPLTGLPNKIGMKHAYGRRKHPKSAVVAMMDLNGFKAINDTYGHDAGDEILKQVSTFLKKHLRLNDVFHPHGDEFIIILKEINRDDARKKITSLLKAIKREKFTVIHGKEVNIGFSAGIVEYSEDNDVFNLDEILKKADLLMLKWKKKSKHSIRYKLRKTGIKNGKRLILKNRFKSQKTRLEREKIKSR